jgi:iron complex transport system ATP-binding protein
MSALLDLTGVSVFLGKRLVVAEISLRIEPGQIVALLGPNGAGKTTLMRAALGLTPIEFGTASLIGDDPSLLSARARARRVAYLPQRPQSIWPISVEHLVALGRFAHGAAPDRLSAPDQAAVDAALEACALGPLRTRRMDEISGGEKARTHLARALAQHAPLLVLDEPTAGLDPAQALSVADILTAHAVGGGAVLFSTHDVALAARIAHGVVLMREGRLISHGPPRETLTRESLEEAYGRKGRLEQVGEALVAVFD